MIKIWTALNGFQERVTPRNAVGFSIFDLLLGAIYVACIFDIFR